MSGINRRRATRKASLGLAVLALAVPALAGASPVDETLQGGAERIVVRPAPPAPAHDAWGHDAAVAKEQAAVAKAQAAAGVPAHDTWGSDAAQDTRVAGTSRYYPYYMRPPNADHVPKSQGGLGPESAAFASTATASTSDDGPSALLLFSIGGAAIGVAAGTAVFVRDRRRPLPL